MGKLGYRWEHPIAVCTIRLFFTYLIHFDFVCAWCGDISISVMWLKVLIPCNKCSVAIEMIVFHLTTIYLSIYLPLLIVRNRFHIHLFVIFFLLLQTTSGISWKQIRMGPRRRPCCKCMVSGYSFPQTLLSLYPFRLRL